MRRMTLAMSVAAMSAAALWATSASAQYWDNPPGSAWQDRGMIEDEGRDPNRFRTPFGYRDYGEAYGAYGYAPRLERRGPPGSRFQTRGLREDTGRERFGREY